MVSKYEHAELLTALWKLGAEPEARLPTSTASSIVHSTPALTSCRNA